MDKIEKIRKFVKELQRDFISIQPKDCSLELIKSYAGYTYLDKVLSFLDTLSEEPDKSLEEAAEEYTQKMLESWRFDSTGCRPLREPFKAGAEWQKKQMLKDAVEVEGVVIDNGSGGTIIDTQCGVLYLPPLVYAVGEKVRIVVLKEEE